MHTTYLLSYFLFPFTPRVKHTTMLVRYRGKWFTIHPRPYEPERMTTDVAWIQMKEGVDAPTAYRLWFERQRKISHLFQQCSKQSLSSESSSLP